MRKELTVALKCHKMLKGSINTENLKLQCAEIVDWQSHLSRQCSLYVVHVSVGWSEGVQTVWCSQRRQAGS